MVYGLTWGRVLINIWLQIVLHKKIIDDLNYKTS